MDLLLNTMINFHEFGKLRFFLLIISIWFLFSSCSAESDNEEKSVTYFGYGVDRNSGAKGTLVKVISNNELYIVNDNVGILLGRTPRFMHDYDDLSHLGIPKSVKINGKKYKVTIIGKDAFEGSPLRSIKIPKNIKRIASGAFRGCSRLNKIEVPRSAEVVDGAFAGCAKDLEISYY